MGDVRMILRPNNDETGWLLQVNGVTALASNTLQGMLATLNHALDLTNRTIRANPRMR
jgi:hypothetical protein